MAQLRYDAPIRRMILLLMSTLAACGVQSQVLVTSLTDEASLTEQAREFWALESIPETAPPDPARQIAVLEFSVIADTGRREGDPQMDFSAELRVRLPKLLYEAFRSLSGNRNGTNVPLGDIISSDGFNELKGKSFSELGFDGHYLCPLKGLLVLNEGQNEKLRSIVRELDADMGVQIRLRVGVRAGRAAILPQSTLFIHTSTASGRLVSRKMLLSDEQVVQDFGDIQVLDPERFVEGLQKLWSPFVSMAQIAVESQNK